jgi:hypothetical protein
MFKGVVLIEVNSNGKGTHRSTPTAQQGTAISNQSDKYFLLIAIHS